MCVRGWGFGHFYLCIFVICMCTFHSSVCFTHKTVNSGVGHLFMKQVVSICRLWKLQSELRCKELSLYLCMDSDIVNHVWCFFWYMLCVGQHAGTYLNVLILFLLHKFYGVQFWFLILIGEKCMPISTLYLISHNMGNSN
jgi:hypothetical protein